MEYLFPNYKFSNFPKAVVAFGNHPRDTDLENLQKHVGALKKFTDGTTQAMEYAKKHAEKLKTGAVIAGKFATVLTILIAVIGEVDELYKKLKSLEQKIYNVILEGKIKALRSNLRILGDSNTSESHKVTEIAIAINNLTELLPMFANDDSIFRERYYVGAPMFAEFCVILKGICLIAERTPGYNTLNLHGLKQDYQNILDWYRIKCIGRRMASCYVTSMLDNPLNLPGGQWTNDWDRHYAKYKKYYETSAVVPWMTYGENLGGKGWRLWFSWMKYCNLIDTWDTRTHDEVTFETFEITITSDLYQSMVKGEPEYQRDVLAEYRRRVEVVMTKFFDEVSVIL